MILYFTATGNSLYVAKKLESNLISIPQLLKNDNHIFEEEKIGLVFPCFHSGVPKIVEDFIERSEFKTQYLYAVITFGAFSGGSINHLIDIAKRNNLKFSYINELLMVDNYLPMFDVKKEIEKVPQKRIEESIQLIVEDLKNMRIYIKKSNKILNFMRSLMDKFYDRNFERKFTINNQCILCGICSKVCPVGNISMKQKPEYSNNCQHCLSCIHNCPTKAINLINQKTTDRYINEHINTKEIIKSNNIL
jgi:ferredoxin/flavodoxin